MGYNFTPLFSEQRYLHGDMALPIFSQWTQVRTSALYTVRAILDTQKKLVCSKHPTQIYINCSFVVDISILQDPDVMTVVHGSIASISFFYDGTVDSVENCSAVNGGNNHNMYTSVHCHYTCKSSPDLSRHTSVLCDPSGNSRSNQFIPHGNSKLGARPYKHTCPSTIKDLEQE